MENGLIFNYESQIEIQCKYVYIMCKYINIYICSPAPAISWRRVDGVPFARKVDMRKISGVLEIPYFQQEDGGTYECIAENLKGRNSVQGKLSFYAPPQLIEKPQDLQKAIGDAVVWECTATGKPKPSYRWMKNGENLEAEERVQVVNGALSISHLVLSDAGIYQCVAGNKYGEVYSNAELRVIAVAPSFTGSQLRAHTLVKEGGDVLVECRPKMSPWGKISWRKGSETLRENIIVIHVSLLTEATVITSPPSTLDVTVGESIVLPCQVTHDPTLELKFTWFFNEQLIHFGTHGGYFEKHSSGDIMIRNIQMRHAGKYTCAVQTKVDSSSIATDLIVRGGVCSFASSWSHRFGDLLSLSESFCFVFSTVPEEVGGRRLTATVIELSPWVEYEFRVLASNELGTGEPSKPSKQARTKETRKSSNLNTQDTFLLPVPEELQNGPGFGYVVAFRPYGSTGWMQAAVPSPDASRYVFKNESIQPFSKFQVKVGVYNNKGEGPFGRVITIYSAEEEPGKAPTRVRAQSVSASEVEVTWKALPWSMKYLFWLYFSFQLRYWEIKEKEETVSMLRTVGNRTAAIIQGLRGSSTYNITVRAYNTAGTGPSSAPISVTTKKPPPSQPPVKVMWNTSNSKIILNWEQVKALENESEVMGYKVRRMKHSQPRVMETNTTSVELSLPQDEEYIIQIKPFGEGGEGSSSRQITIPRVSGTLSPVKWTV
uniref:Contactin 4 n=1 Tax=Astyanax mexicanus TaxID=7994 RepID=A0A8B9RJ56_ASTMX